MSKPIVSIIMGSDSDLPLMQEAAKVLQEFKIPFEVTALSAHRAPAAVAKYARTAAQRGLRVIIAGAGVAAHLPGVIAAFTPLPVIGVPIKSSATAGIDSLFAIAQMPPGVPVATVAINGAKNAGILAVQILAASDKKLQKKIVEYKKGMKVAVLAKAKKLGRMGFMAYLRDAGLV
ncbi:MAG: 5-(carboxyamino)imidazole ribonucleotide mutase [Candidatus Liptonbacteria bacterium RIFCSPHIGHO2_01_FULL_57_28]|uniref:N5-carboxyaminoimidazole ribonucleotide mutase n=1 Tax=Candidatus Liptonbacteria bacterium RIFCSPHIGHO2_01_FULL_57_28 TaxID=1798647 RepID=A0A1G2CEE3_9BACT|nr:MAG: 5-(carboxyamino)imidazole ribonucleotide mutase [Candidatus Liptonbacteria bacterium RIFCSPHIGHO2_01_FULL_57_28]